MVVGTVKVHNHHIFGKLGVSDRVQALMRARQLNRFDVNSPSHEGKPFCTIPSGREVSGAVIYTDELVITHGTAKWYVSQILGKLGVQSRTQAVARGRELGLLA